MYSSGDTELFNVSLAGDGLTSTSTPTPGVNEATNGGGLYIAGGTTTPTGVLSIINNNVTGSGAGVYVTNGGQFIKNAVDTGFCKRLTINNNDAKENGGGIYIENGGTVNLEGYYSSDSGVVISSDRRVIISNNEANNGGGVYNLGSLTLSCTFGSNNYYGVDIKSNEAFKNGGGIYNSGLNASLNGPNKSGGGDQVYVRSNISANYGGGIYTTTNMTICGTIISGNDSTEYGGGICVDGGTTAITGYVNISSNMVSKDGAGVYVNAGTFTNVSAGTPPTYSALIIGGTSTPGNTAASGNGGGIYQNGGTITLTEDATHNVEISYNEAQNGGGVYVNAGMLNLNGASDSNLLEVKNNKATGTGTNGLGGQIYSKSTTNLNNVSLAGDGLTSTSTPAGVDEAILGGGLYVAGGTTTAQGTVSITQNNAANGAGVYVNGGTFTNVIGTTYGNLTIGGSGNANTASGNGGGIYNAADGTVTLNGSYATGTGNDRRVQINNNSAVDGGGIYNLGNLTLTSVAGVSNGSVYTPGLQVASNTATGNGGGIWNKNASETATTISGGNNNTNRVFINNNQATGMASKGGGIYTESDITLTNVRIHDQDHTRKVANLGGGIYVADGTTTLSSDNSTAVSIDHLQADQGGGIYVEDGGTLQVNSGAASINSNSASDGAGVYVDNGGTVRLNAGTTTISQNSAVNGAGVYVDNGGMFTNVSTDATPTYGTVTIGGTGNANTTTGTTGKGGGIYNAAGGTVDLNTKTIISYNTANQGAGVYNESINLNLDTVTIDHNSTTGTNGLGGGLYNSANVTTAIESVVVTNNTATNGAGVYNIGQLVIAGTSSIASNTANNGLGGGIYTGDGADDKLTLQGTTTITNNSSNYGAGIYVAKGTLTNVLTVGSTTTYGALTIGGTDNGNTADDNGGGIFQEFGTINLVEGENSGTVAEIEISYNQANSGGGVFVGNGTSNFTLTGYDAENNALVDNNWAKGSGGGIYNAEIDFHLNNVTISNNNAAISRTENGTGTYVYTYNNTNTGGGLINESDAVVNYSGTNTISNNTAYNGGGLYNLGTINGTTTDGVNLLVNNNAATNNGGGIYQTSAAPIVLNDGDIIAHNTASEGAGVYINSGSITINNSSSTVSNNTASLNGGGFYVTATGTLNVGTATINGNTANGLAADNLNRGGGGIYNLGVVAVTTALTMESNNAPNGFGGAIYNGGAGTITGGNLIIGGNALTAANNAYNGGGIYQNSAAALTLDKDDTVTFNTATNGAGIYVNSTLNFSNSETANVTGNRATGNGGGFYVSSTGTLNLTDSTGTLIQSNYADNGGGMYLDGTLTKTVTAKLTFSQNNSGMTTANNGGGLFIGANADYNGTNLFQINSTDKGTLLFSQNGTTAKTHGGAIYVGTGVSLKFATDYIFGNAGDGSSLVADSTYTNYGTGAAVFSVGTVTNQSTLGNYNAGSAETTDTTEKISTKTFSLFVTGQSGDGAIGVGTGGAVTLSNVKIYNNASGGVIVEGGLMTLEDGTEIGVDQSSAATTSYSNTLYNDAFGMITSNAAASAQKYGAKVTGGTLFVAEAVSKATYKNEWKDSTNTAKGRYADIAVKDTVKISGNTAGVIVTDGAAYINDARIEANGGTGFEANVGTGFWVSGGTVGVYNTLIADNRIDANVTVAADQTVTFNNTTIVGSTVAGTKNNTIDSLMSGVNFVTDALGNKYTLGPNSTAYNTGNNALVQAFTSIGGTDLRNYTNGADIAGHHRVLYNKVDYGCFEQPIYWVTKEDSLEDIKQAVENVETIDNGGKVCFDSTCNNESFKWENAANASTIVINKSTIIDGRSNIAGKYNWQNITLDADKKSGLFGIDTDNIEVSIYGLTLKNGSADNHGGLGGAICNPAPGVTLRLYSVSCIGCDAFSRGGAIFSDYGSNLEITTPEMENGYLQSVFANNTAGSGGAIYIDSPGKYNTVKDADGYNFTLSGIQFYDATGENATGGAIFPSTEKASGLTSDYITSFHGKTKKTDDNLAQYSIRFYNNEASRYGGAVDICSGNKAKIDKISFLSNDAGYLNGTSAGTGGAVITNAPLTIGNVDFISNTANYNGGALSVGTGSTTTITGNVTFANNDSQGKQYGGALFADHGGVIQLSENPTGTTAGFNLVTNKYDDGKTVTTQGDGYVLEFQYNSAYVGGAISSIGGTITLNSIYAANNSATYGGAVSSAGGTITINSNTKQSLFERNTASTGGAIASNGGTTIVNGALIRCNTANCGGGAASVTGTVTLDGGELSQNQATVNGGGVYVLAGLTSSAIITLNYAAQYGGGLYFHTSQTAGYTGINVEKNWAGVNGGGWYNANGTATDYGAASGNWAANLTGDDEAYDNKYLADQVRTDRKAWKPNAATELSDILTTLAANTGAGTSVDKSTAGEAIGSATQVDVPQPAASLAASPVEQFFADFEDVLDLNE